MIFNLIQFLHSLLNNKLTILVDTNCSIIQPIFLFELLQTTRLTIFLESDPLLLI